MSQFQERPECTNYQHKHFVTESSARFKLMTVTTTTGRAPVLTLEEVELIGHLKEIANLGYGFTRQEVVDIASDYAYGLWCTT